MLSCLHICFHLIYGSLKNVASFITSIPIKFKMIFLMEMTFQGYLQAAEVKNIVYLLLQLFSGVILQEAGTMLHKILLLVHVF